MCDCPFIPGNYCCFKNPFKPVTHVIFDLDGTLLDTEEIDRAVFNELCKEFGKKYTEELHELVLGTNESSACERIVKHLKLDIDPKEFQAKFQEKNYKLVPDAKFMCGAEKLVNHFFEQQIPLAIATSSTAEAVCCKVSKKKDFFDKFHHVVCGNSDPEVLRGKPFPNIYFVAARRFEERPRRIKCLVFEDAFNGVVAALGAGMQVVMVPTPVTPYEKWRYATLRLDSLDGFIPELFGIPAFGSPKPPKKVVIVKGPCKPPIVDPCEGFEEEKKVEEKEDPCKEFEMQNGGRKEADMKVTNY